MNLQEEKIKIIYLLGAGRSGTTLLATVLNNHPQIFTIGEMHQFLDYLKDNKDCSCGEVLTECKFWAEILKEIDLDTLKKDEVVTYSNKKEKHWNIPKHLVKKYPDKKYSEFIDEIFIAIRRHTNGEWLLDSSKYISRYLLLRKNPALNVKGIYMVRDVRGVVNSFKKKVQTTKTPLSAILYYVLINLWAQLVCSLDKRILKIRYEDFVQDPDAMLKKIELHLFEKNFKNISLSDKTFKMPHIIAGNRLRSQKELVINKDLEWKNKISRGGQILYYTLAFPIMILNKYRV